MLWCLMYGAFEFALWAHLAITFITSFGSIGLFTEGWRGRLSDCISGTNTEHLLAGI